MEAATPSPTPDPSRSSEKTGPDTGACTHFQPADLAAAAQADLEKSGLDPAAWEGIRYGWGTNEPTSHFRALYMETCRRNGQWVLTRLDRRKEILEAERLGLKRLEPDSPLA